MGVDGGVHKFIVVGRCRVNSRGYFGVGWGWGLLGVDCLLAQVWPAKPRGGGESPKKGKS